MTSTKKAEIIYFDGTEEELEKRISERLGGTLPARISNMDKKFRIWITVEEIKDAPSQ